MVLEIAQLDPARKYGVIVTGLTENDLESGDMRSKLRQLWGEHGLLTFRGMISSCFQIKLSKIFGELEIHPVEELLDKENPELINIDYDPATAAVWEVNGVELGSWLPWHSDLVFMNRINRGGILRAIDVPSAGGETIENLYVVYKMKVDYEGQRYTSDKLVRLSKSSKYIESMKQREDIDFPCVIHPVVFTHPETNQKVLNISPTCAEYVYEMDATSGHKLLMFLTRHVSSEKFAYYHKWSLDEIVLWDNWRSIHCSTGVIPGHIRRMQRTTIVGDYKLGYDLRDYIEKSRQPANLLH
jgi:taurine dioxygenase